MCKKCWIEAGEPRFESPNLRDLATRLRKLDRLGACHPVIVDWNVDNINIAYCLTEENIKPSEAFALKELLTLSEDRRYSVMAMTDGHY